MKEQNQAAGIAKNVGPLDRLVRAVIVVALWLWPLATPLPVAVTEVLALMGGALLVTIVTGHCVVYSLFHLSTGPLPRRV